MPLYYDIDSSAVIAYKLFLYLIAAITFTVTPIFIYAVTYKSSKLMSSYRALVLAYLPFSMITTLTTTLSCPIFDYPSNGYHFYDKIIQFENFGAAFQLVFQLVIYICDMIITDLLLFMLIDRYDVVSKNITTRSNWIFPLCYTVITITNLFAILIIIANIILFVFDPKDTMYAQFIVIKRLLMPTTLFSIYFNLSFNLIIVLKHCAFLGNMVTTLYFVIPYREYILRLLNLRLRQRKAKTSAVHLVEPMPTNTTALGNGSRRISTVVM
uniref:Serpentine receptor class gamma n=1 Tax=Panagrellus redivivus TaxID=6233 RepID=A0A7E4ZX06_PANRE